MNEHVNVQDRQEMPNIFWLEFLFEISKRQWECPLGGQKRSMFWN